MTKAKRTKKAGSTPLRDKEITDAVLKAHDKREANVASQTKKPSRLRWVILAVLVLSLAYLGYMVTR